MSGRLIRHESDDEVPKNLQEYLKADAAMEKAGQDIQDLIDSPEPPEDWAKHVLPVTGPMSAEQQAEVAEIQAIYDKSEARAQLLLEATQIVTVDRNVTHGPPENTFATIAELWSTYLGIELLTQDVSALMVLMKVARVRTNPTHRDSWVDIAGYAACGGTMPAPEEE